MTPERTISIPELYTDLAAGAFASPTDSPDRVGIEAEFFLLRPSRFGTAAAQVTNEVNAEGGEYGLFDWIDRLAADNGWKRGPGSSGDAPEWVTPSGSRITLEPGGQIEISTPPCTDVDHALAEIARIESIARERADDDRLLLLPTGYHDHLGGAHPALVVRKPRYLLMDEHFSEIGPWGRMMMRSTCSTQVNLDFGRPERGMKRWRLAVYLSQIIGILFSTSELTRQGRTYANFRSEIWRRTDPCRTGVPAGITGSDPVAAWLDFALDATVMFLDDRQGGLTRPSRPVTFREWLSGTDGLPGWPDIDDWRTHLTTLFPDVRPRGFIEIRTLDAMPPDRRDQAVRTLVNALYDDARSDELLDIFESGHRPGEDPILLRRTLTHLLRSA